MKVKIGGNFFTIASWIDAPDWADIMIKNDTKELWGHVRACQACSFNDSFVMKNLYQSLDRYSLIEKLIYWKLVSFFLLNRHASVPSQSIFIFQQLVRYSSCIFRYSKIHSHVPMIRQNAYYYFCLEKENKRF